MPLHQQNRPRDAYNHKANSVGVTISSKADADNKLVKGINPDIGVPAAGDANSTTHSAISLGTIEIRNGNTDPSKLSRNTENAVNALGKIFDKKTVQEQQELAQVFGEEAFKLVGDIAQKNGWKEGSPEKVALHAVVGGIMSDLGGSSFTSGAVGAGLNQAVQRELAKIKDPGLRLSASALVGAAAAKIAGGNAQAGASTAVSGTKYNDYHHRTFKEGEIVCKDGKWYVYKDGKDVPIEKPNQYGIIVLIENKDDPDNGWDYVLWNGSKNDTYFPGTIGSQYITEDSSGKQSMAYVNVFDPTGVLGNLNPIVDENKRIGLADAMTLTAEESFNAGKKYALNPLSWFTSDTEYNSWNAAFRNGYDYQCGRKTALNPLSAFLSKQDIYEHSSAWKEGFYDQNNAMYRVLPPKYIVPALEGVMMGLTDGLSGPPKGPTFAPVGPSSSYTLITVPTVYFSDDFSRIFSSSGASGGTTNSEGPSKAGDLSKATNPKEFLDTALERQGLKTTPNRLKETWIEGDYKYEVRIHEADPQYGKTGSIYRVSRQKINIPEGQQGTGVEYMDSNGTWHHQSTLKPGKSGNINPNYNDVAAKETHIQVD